MSSSPVEVTTQPVGLGNETDARPDVPRGERGVCQISDNLLWCLPNELPDPSAEHAVTTESQASQSPLDAGFTTRSPVVVTLPRRTAVPWSRCEQSWEGVVLDADEEGFNARLVDVSGSPDLETRFEFAEISPDDLALVEEGAIFYWNLGYKDSPSGQRERYSMLRFRRLPGWTARQLDAAERQAQATLGELGWD